MTLASSMILVDQTAVPLVSPDAIKGIGGSIAEGQWLMTANILPLAALMVFGGRLGDLFGLRRVFIWGAVLFTAATAAMGAAQNVEWAIAARALQGAGAALMMPTALAIVSAASRWRSARSSSDSARAPRKGGGAQSLSGRSSSAC